MEFKVRKQEPIGQWSEKVWLRMMLMTEKKWWTCGVNLVDKYVSIISIVYGALRPLKSHSKQALALKRWNGLSLLFSHARSTIVALLCLMSMRTANRRRNKTEWTECQPVSLCLYSIYAIFKTLLLSLSLSVTSRSTNRGRLRSLMPRWQFFQLPHYSYSRLFFKFHFLHSQWHINYPSSFFILSDSLGGNDSCWFEHCGYDVLCCARVYLFRIQVYGIRMDSIWLSLDVEIKTRTIKLFHT